MSLGKFFFLILGQGIVLFLAGNAQAAETQVAAPENETDGNDSIVVMAPRSSALGTLIPEIVLNQRQIASYGVGTVEELLDELQQQTRGSSGLDSSRPVILVNGRRALSISELRELPTEAIQNVEILPEEVALRYGQKQGKKVVNIILRPNYVTRVAEAWGWAASEGGYSTLGGKVSAARTFTGGRWNIYAAGSRNDWLLEGERSLLGGLGRFRSLLPRFRRFSLGGSWTRDLSADAIVVLSGSFEGADSRARTGPDIALTLDGSVIVPGSVPLERIGRDRSSAFNVGASGSSGAWLWSFNSGYSNSRNRTVAALSAAETVAASQSRQIGRYDIGKFDAVALLNGALVSMPAGDAAASVQVSFETVRNRIHNSSPDLRTLERFRRERVALRSTLDVPIVGDKRGSSQIWLSLSAELAKISDFGTLKSYSYGLNWTPAPIASFSASVTDDERAPSPEDLSRPLTLLPNYRLYDFGRGETAYFTLIEGGNAQLPQSRMRSTAVSVTVRPLSRTNLALSFLYLRTTSRNDVGYLPGPTPEFEAAFPDRFSRDPSGRLVSFDSRPVVFARTSAENLRWGIEWSSRFGQRSPTRDLIPADVTKPAGARELVASAVRNDDRRVQFSFYHTYRIDDELIIGKDLPRIDYLDGALAGPSGGRPRHQFDIKASAYLNGFGASITGTLQSGTRVVVPDEHAAADTLLYSSVARLNFQLFTNIGEWGAGSWLDGMRIAIDIKNMLNDRPKVRGSSGRQPSGLQSPYLDPLGRTIKLTLRKVL